MNLRLVNRISRMLLAVFGLAATWFAAVNADRLSAEGADAGPEDYLLLVALPLVLCGASLAGRIFLRRGEQPAAGSSVTPHLAALGTQIGQLTAEGNMAGARALLQAAESLHQETVS